MPTRFATALLAVLVLLFLPLGCAKLSPSGLHRVELTKDDIVSLFNLPLAQARLDKFEWDFSSRRYVRVIIERSDDSGRTWRERSVFVGHQAVSTATFVYFLADPPPTQPADSVARYTLKIRLGGRTMTTGYWTEGVEILEFPDRQLQTESIHSDPNRILTIRSGAITYRLRLEAQNQPWPQG